MLELKNIKKTYKTISGNVHALKGINLKFRKSEFVSILGESGCGKTTLLNIIGGLDRYTSGDLIINGKSTKKFKDRDWDSYRNYSIGFIFQNYNLIGHQNILSNVELALTISGVSKNERRNRAIKALEQVGLKDKIYYKPNELSGGQMQRVAIARALVNDPDIILADEPTGALDSKTSVGVMEILKKVSKDKLIIMVTHNDRLAEEYSDRIIKILDGQITDDSHPLNKNEKPKEFKYGKTIMHFKTALSLSLNNLLTKKGRTILTSFAGSIGIIGIALILSISAGVQGYIDKIEEDTVSNYPITIEKSSVDLGTLMKSMMDESTVKNKQKDKIYSKKLMDEMINIMSSKSKTNNLEKFKQNIEKNKELKENTNAIMYGYNLNLNIYKDSEEIYKVNPSDVMETIGMGDMIKARESAQSMFGQSMSMGSTTDVFTKIIDNEKLVKSQYELLDGKYPEEYNEVVLIVNKDNELSDYVLYNLGILDKNELKENMKKAEEGIVKETKTKVYSYDDFIGLELKILLNTDYYKKEGNIYVNAENNEEYMKSKIKDAEKIKIVGVIKPKQTTTTTEEIGSIGYIKELEEHVISKTNESEIVKHQKENPDINIFTGTSFPKEGEKVDINSLTESQKRALMNMSPSEITAMMEAYKDSESSSLETNLEKLGAVDLQKPSTISIYPKDFNSKENIGKIIEKYNKKQAEENKITYSDIVGIMISSVSQIVNTISYVLIAFVAVSLIVSSIMIGIITYISVLERTKEIGILRSIGVSKKDISRIFSAETLIIGLISGLIGVGITVILTFPINHIIYKATGVVVKTYLPLPAAIILIIISVILTRIGGSIPSKMASKQDPVIALRTE